ncbi:MAG: FAD-dependent oxidoreductase [Actinomycetota bacterium]|nr:FAD-dependent oxidoreductase [Actinomycetota bacterium]PLS75431.1 MAG: carotene 7,8-desaturase [Actinomycetota bacterium]
MTPGGGGRVVVVGGGLAGLSCAFELSDRGVPVLLLEAGDVVGGRTASWAKDGMAVESGLHRFLGFFSALPRLLERAGVDLGAMVCWEDEIEIRLPDGGPSGVLGMAPLHRPLRTLAGVLANNRLLTPLDKLKLARFMAAGLRDYVRRPDELDRRSVTGYAKAHGVSDRAVHNLLVPLTAGLFFLPPERFSAAIFFGLLAPGVPRLHQMRLGAYMGGMTEVMCAPIARGIEARGGEVRTGVEVDELVVRDGRVEAVVAGGQTIGAGHVVVATSIEPAQRLLRPAFEDHPWFAPMLSMGTTPSVTVQLELDRPSMDVDRTTFGPGTALACFAEQCRTTFRHARGRLSIILTPPERFLAMEPDEVLAVVIEDAGRLGLELEGHVTDFRVVAHPHDFHCLEPGHLGLRPDQETPVAGLSLAGDYTHQRFMASMEGAVISGQRAAELAAAAHAHGRRAN